MLFLDFQWNRNALRLGDDEMKMSWDGMRRCGGDGMMAFSEIISRCEGIHVDEVCFYL